MTSANDILNVARKYIGDKEGSTAHKHILSVYNSTKPLPRGYKVKASDNWCATFISFLAIEAGKPNLYGRECSVQQFIGVFKSRGIWHEDGRILPKVGDLITYNWDDHTQGNNGWADHIGIVEEVNGNQITVIEGNKANAVGRRVVTKGAGQIRGYARPKYGKKAEPSKPTPAPSKPTPAPSKPTPAPSKPTPAPSKPSHSIAVDGYWGSATTKRLQEVYGTPVDGRISKPSLLVKAMQKRLGVKADGYRGPITYRAMQRALGTPVDGKVSSSSLMVKAMQRKLNANKKPF